MVASKSGDDISFSSSLAIVPYGEGEIVLRRHSGTNAAIVSHYSGKAVIASVASIENGQLKITAQRNLDGMPLEWIEVRIW